MYNIYSCEGGIGMNDKPKIATPKVTLLGYTNTLNGQGPEGIVATAGKLCYSKSDIVSLNEKLSEEDIKNFINTLTSYGHYSVFEHANFTFGIEGISRTCSHQIVRHRTGSYSQQSQRYVNLDNSFEFIIPEEIANCEEAKKVYIDSIYRDYDAYRDITIILVEEYINSGIDKKSAIKKALEDARFALPNACETKLIMTMDARNLLHFFEERCCMRAQWEIRDVANQMLDLVLDVAPNLFAKAGPSCAFGKCKEGAMSCGNIQEPKEKQKVKKYER